MAGVPAGGSLVITVTHAPISAKLADDSIALLRNVGPEVRGIEIVFLESAGAKGTRRAVRAYRRATPTGPFTVIP